MKAASGFSCDGQVVKHEEQPVGSVARMKRQSEHARFALRGHAGGNVQEYRSVGLCQICDDVDVTSLLQDKHTVRLARWTDNADRTVERTQARESVSRRITR